MPQLIECDVRQSSECIRKLLAQLGTEGRFQARFPLVKIQIKNVLFAQFRAQCTVGGTIANPPSNKHIDGHGHACHRPRQVAIATGVESEVARVTPSCCQPNGDGGDDGIIVHLRCHFAKIVIIVFAAPRYDGNHCALAPQRPIRTVIIAPIRRCGPTPCA